MAESKLYVIKDGKPHFIRISETLEFLGFEEITGPWGFRQFADQNPKNLNSYAQAASNHVRKMSSEELAKKQAEIATKAAARPTYDPIASRALAIAAYPKLPPEALPIVDEFIRKDAELQSCHKCSAGARQAALRALSTPAMLAKLREAGI
jgi:hypothetical protein